MSYRMESARPRLENPRPRSPVPPIRIRSPGNIPSTLPSPTTLLYDLPQSSSRSPPPQSADMVHHSPPPPKSPPLSASPPQAPQRLRATPPPLASANPTQAARQELDQFAAHCRAWYFDQDERAGELVAQIVESLPPSQRALYSRVQASTRSAYHTAMSKRRRSEFRAHLSSIHPGGSLSPHARSHPHGKTAKKERFDKFYKFLRTWCTTGMPGTQPFFQGLWALMRLQMLPVELGGAGSKRIEWEIDDAVFQESAGKDFMLEAIDIIKGVIEFEEYLPMSSRRHSEEPNSPTPMPPPSPITRPRSPSDPFLDTPAPIRTSASQSSNIQLSQQSTDEIAMYASPRLAHKELPDDGGKLDSDEPYLRLWTAGDLDNPELQRLVSLFPAFITRQPLPRFYTPHSGRHPPQDLEEGLEIAGGAEEVQCGTGRMWVSEKDRREGWKGSWWHRFTGWWRRLFC